MAFQDLQTAEHLTRSKNPRDEKIIQIMSPLRDSIVARGFELLFFGGGDRLLDLVRSIVSLPLAVVQLSVARETKVVGRCFVICLDNLFIFKTILFIF